MSWTPPTSGRFADVSRPVASTLGRNCGDVFTVEPAEDAEVFGQDDRINGSFSELFYSWLHFDLSCAEVQEES